jgi:hypothetical protein
VELAEAGGWVAPDAVQAAAARRGGGLVRGGGGCGRVGPSGWDGMVCWTESGCEPNGLCRFGVKKQMCDCVTQPVAWGPRRTQISS